MTASSLSIPAKEIGKEVVFVARAFLSDARLLSERKKFFYSFFLFSGLVSIQFCAWEAIPQSIRIGVGIVWSCYYLAKVLEKAL